MNVAINGKMMLRIGNRYIHAGEEFEAPENLVKKLKKAGLVETATAKPPENAMMPKPKPKHIGGGWYLTADGKKVRKKDLEEGD